MMTGVANYPLIRHDSLWVLADRVEQVSGLDEAKELDPYILRELAPRIVPVLHRSICCDPTTVLLLMVFTQSESTYVVSHSFSEVRCLMSPPTNSDLGATSGVMVDDMRKLSKSHLWAGAVLSAFLRMQANMRLVRR